MTEAARGTILIVDDDAGIARLECIRLQRTGYAAVAAGTFEEALRHIEQSGVDLLVIDYNLQERTTGIEFYEQLKQAGRSIPAILVTGYCDESILTAAIRAGICDFVPKTPGFLDYLVPAVDRAVKQLRVERQLAETEARMSRIFNAALDAIITIDADQCIDLLNPAAEEMLQCSAETARGQPIQRFVPSWPAAGKGAEAWTTPGAFNRPIRFETTGLRGDGSPFPLEGALCEVHAAGGTFSTLIARDITERKSADEERARFIRDQAVRDEEAAARAVLVDLEARAARERAALLVREQQARQEAEISEERYRLLAECLPQFVWTVTADGETDYVNHHWFEYSGLNFQESQGTGWRVAMHPDDFEQVLQARARARETGHGYQLECRFLRASDQTYRWHLVRVVPMRSASGQLLKWLGTAADIEDQKRVEQQILKLNGELHRRVAELQTLLDAIPVGIGIAENAECLSIVSNPALARMLGIGVGANASLAVPVSERPAPFKVFRHGQELPPAELPMHVAAATGTNVSDMELEIRRHDASEVKLQVGAVPLFDESGRARGSVGVFIDVTDQKRVSEELQRAKDAAESANRAKTEFLANISHELRTPMNAIIGMTELALDEELSPGVRDHLETVQDSADVLLGLLNEILDFSKLEAGKLTLERIPFNLRHTLAETMKTLASQASEKGLELISDIPRNVPSRLVGDSLRLRQVLVNLVGNAMKFTEQGEVVVRVSVQASTDDDVRLLFAVSDTGIGISADNQKHIFAPFTQADASTTRLYGGTGLGLAIVTNLLNIMQGRLWVESELGRGSTFYFTVRFDRQRETESADDISRALDALHGTRILVVDDNATSRDILATVLRDYGLIPEVAADGEAALQHLRASLDSPAEFPCVIADGLMPGLDGFTLMERIREELRVVPKLVLMLSLADRQTFAQRCAQLNTDAVLDKPVSEAGILDALSTAFGIGSAPHALAPHPGKIQGPVTHRLNILLAEDLPANQRLITQVLAKRGHNVEIAHNGREAVDRVRQEAFDIVLMDVQMPIMDGFQATAAIRAMHEGEPWRMPILAMTAHALRGDRERCLEAGMDGYIAKPIDIHKLIELVEQLGSSARGETGGEELGKNLTRG